MTVTIGGIYQHYKGGLYQVIALSTGTETESIEVIYVGARGDVWNRPLKMWGESVEGVLRFTLLKDQLSAYRRFQQVKYALESSNVIKPYVPRYVISEVSEEGQLNPMLFHPHIKNLMDTSINLTRKHAVAYAVDADQAQQLADVALAAQMYAELNKNAQEIIEQD